MAPQTRDCVYLVTGAVTYYTVFPLMYAGTIFALVARVYQIRRGTKRRKYRDTQPNNGQDPLEAQAFLQRHLHEMESQKSHGWSHPQTARALETIPDYEPPDYVTVVDSSAAGDSLLPGNGLKPERLSRYSRHSRIPSISSALHYYFDVSAPPPVPAVS